MDLRVVSVAERPDLAKMLDEFPSAWPTFMYHDPLAGLLYTHADGVFAEFCLLAFDPDRPNRPVAKAYSAPFRWGGDPAVDLPDAGWDAVLLRAVDDSLAGRRGNLVSALEITVQPDLRGIGLARQMVDALRHNTARLGYGSMVAPVRPNGKHHFPDLPMRQYLELPRDDGLPYDPWLRTHVRAGGRIVGIAPRSMTILAALDDWRRWTGLPFAETGPVSVPDALVPVRCDLEAGWAVYVEPNVWVHHDLLDPA
jgi:GNAT superfamily N-acetyltransferase